MKDERNRCDLDNERLHKALEDGINTLKSLEKEARRLDAENSKLNSYLAMAEKDYSDVLLARFSSSNRPRARMN